MWLVLRYVWVLFLNGHSNRAIRLALPGDGLPSAMLRLLLEKLEKFHYPRS